MNTSHGGPWSRCTVQMDSEKSPFYGINLNPEIQQRRLADFVSGDQVTLEVLRGERVWIVTGRASRKATAYFKIIELHVMGIDVHEQISCSVFAINGRPVTPVTSPEEERLARSLTANEAFSETAGDQPAADQIEDDEHTAIDQAPANIQPNEDQETQEAENDLATNPPAEEGLEQSDAENNR